MSAISNLSTKDILEDSRSPLTIVRRSLFQESLSDLKRREVNALTYSRDPEKDRLLGLAPITIRSLFESKYQSDWPPNIKSPIPTFHRLRRMHPPLMT